MSEFDPLRTPAHADIVGAMRNKIVVAHLILLGACTHVPLPQGPPSPVVSRSWLVGAWVEETQNCESDAGINYRADGTWSAYETNGTWRLEGSTLVSVVTERSWGGAETPVRVAEPSAHRIQIVGPNAYKALWERGSAIYLRCPDWGD